MWLLGRVVGNAVASQHPVMALVSRGLDQQRPVGQGPAALE